MWSRLAALLVLCLALAWPGAASASSLSVQPVGKGFEVFYVAALGEENSATASTDGAVVTVVDPGAEMEAGPGCAPVSDHEATCNFPAFATVHFELRGGDDSARVTGPMIIMKAEGGGGRDRLVGGQLFDQLDGGPGADVLNGRGQSDVVLYTDRPDDLRVTLGDGKRNDGGPMDGTLRDRLRSIEVVLGGDGDDLLVGTGGENSLFAGDGRDVVRGNGGPDDLGGQSGRDRAFGGGGADLFPGDTGRDRHFGGKGADYFQGGSVGNGADLFAGEGGHDTVDYTFGQIRVSLDGKANDGRCADPTCASSDEGDNASGIEEITATFGADVLIGSGRDEVFHPFPGADTVRAKGGNDTVHLSIDGAVDDVNCGPGIDDVLGTPDVFDMNKNCE
jgi:RTX calcium-binding nonapeptide repeat (4 copies)